MQYINTPMEVKNETHFNWSSRCSNGMYLDGNDTTEESHTRLHFYRLQI